MRVESEPKASAVVNKPPDRKMLCSLLADVVVILTRKTKATGKSRLRIRWKNHVLRYSASSMRKIMAYCCKRVRGERRCGRYGGSAAWLNDRCIIDIEAHLQFCDAVQL